MTSETLTSLGAGYVPATLLPDALVAWSGPVRYTDANPAESRDGVLLGADPDYPEQHVVASIEGWYVMNTFVETRAVRAVALDLPLARAEVRHRVCVVMAAGLRRASTAGYLRTPAPCWHLLPQSEGGQLPNTLAAHSATLIVAHVASVTTGGPGIRDLLGAWRKVSDADPDTGETWIRSRVLDPRNEHGGLWCGSQLQPWRDFGWQNSCVPGGITRWLQGPEVGDAGKIAIDASALVAGFALLDGAAVRAPCGPQLIFTSEQP